MKRSLPLLTLLLLLPLALGCARTTEMTSDTARAGGGVSDDMMMTTPVEGGTDKAMKLLGASTSPRNTIVENAMAVPNLSNLVEAVKAAGLAETLSGPGPFTVFAPTNAAFDLIDKTEFSMMMSEDKQAELAALLKAHVAEGSVSYGELNDGTMVVMLSGDELPVGMDDADRLQKRIGLADIIVYDIESSNGTIHVINLVLDPMGNFSQG